MSREKATQKKPYSSPRIYRLTAMDVVRKAIRIASAQDQTVPRKGKPSEISHFHGLGKDMATFGRPSQNRFSQAGPPVSAQHQKQCTK
ncbi:MAG: hypothetical protein L0387_42410 [Acidobacteria bacterium]|nr:hypothetical protein [Acidobacteriota bacterium]